MSPKHAPVRKHLPPRMTPKQIRVLKALLKRNDDGTLLDVQQLIERCAPGTSRGAMLCSLRHLMAHQLMEEGKLDTRRGRVVRTYKLTAPGYALLKPLI